MPWLTILKNITYTQSKLIIACSCLKKIYRLFLRDNRNAKKFQIIILNVPKSTIIERLKTRHGHYAKADLLDSQFKTLETPDSTENDYVHLIDASETVEKTIQSIIKNYLINN